MPKTSYTRLIDVWLLFAINMQVLTMMLHTYIAYLIKEKKGVVPVIIGKSTAIMPTQDLKTAKMWNNAAKIGFALLIICFNVGFWYIAIKEYTRPPESYIKDRSD